MRDIRFRGRRVDSGEWIYGSLIDRDIIVSGPVDADGEYIGLGEWCSVEPETVGQYTGLKDRNGKEIYEGDVISFDDMGEEGYEYKEGYDFVNRAVVTFEDGRFTLDNFMETNSGVFEEMHDHRELQGVIEHSEVIGNIHEHPHLLKGE